jgi:hypothetical protein
MHQIRLEVPIIWGIAAIVVAVEGSNATTAAALAMSTLLSLAPGKYLKVIKSGPETHLRVRNAAEPVKWNAPVAVGRVMMTEIFRKYEYETEPGIHVLKRL